MIDDLVKQLREYGSCGMVFKAANRIEKLERDVLEYGSAIADAQMQNEDLNRALNRMIDRWEKQSTRIEKLETALRSIAANACCNSCREAALVARKALDAK